MAGAQIQHAQPIHAPNQKHGIANQNQSAKQQAATGTTIIAQIAHLQNANLHKSGTVMMRHLVQAQAQNGARHRHIAVQQPILQLRLVTDTVQVPVQHAQKNRHGIVMTNLHVQGLVEIGASQAGHHHIIAPVQLVLCVHLHRHGIVMRRLPVKQQAATGTTIIALPHHHQCANPQSFGIVMTSLLV